MPRLGPNRWGKSEVRISKVHRGEVIDDFSDITVQVILEGDVELAHTEGDNSSVIPTDTMRNTIYALAQDSLTRDIEAFGAVLCSHFLEGRGVSKASVFIAERPWTRQSETGFTGGGSERRLAGVVRGSEEETTAGIEGLVVLKTRGSGFAGFPRDRYTTLPDKDDRLLATSITAKWVYSRVPEDTSVTWNRVRDTILERFFDDWSASLQHQGYQIGVAVLEAEREISEISFRLPNQHHLPFDLTRFEQPDLGIVFHPVSEPYGDIAFTVRR